MLALSSLLFSNRRLATAISVSPQEMLRAALAHHQAGRLAEAINNYELLTG
jgi:hypothetical protein